MNPVLSALMQSFGGAVPPFLARSLAQQKGIQEFGTNQPNPTILPPGAPALSTMAWSQMDPSEQQAFLSYISALGIDPADYLALIQRLAPQGGRAQAPLFGASLTPYWQ